MKHKAFFPIIAGAVVCLGLATAQLRAEEPGVEEIPAPGETVGSEEGGVILPDGNDGGLITVEGGGEITVGGDEGGGTVVDSDGGGEVTITPTEEGGETTVDGGDGTVVANDDTTGTSGPPEGTTDDPAIYSPLAENNSPTSQALNSIQSNVATDSNNWDAATIHSVKEADGYSVEDNSKQTDLKATRQDGRVFLKTQP